MNADSFCREVVALSDAELGQSAADLAAEVVALAVSQGARVAVAESLTGGLLAAELVAVSGASAVVTGAVVAYDTRIKASVLGVCRKRLLQTGPVDWQIAAEMAQGVVRLMRGDGDACDVDRVDDTGDVYRTVGGGVAGAHGEGTSLLGIATTGVAGPAVDWQSGAEPGLFYVGFCAPNRAESVRFYVPGERNRVRKTAVFAGLVVLKRLLQLESCAA
ncbi:CinA family protein [Canibacter sp. lx-72]|nr:CinA family protein [Canibacter zhuwentaonis]